MVYKYIDRNVRLNTSEGPAGQFTRKFKDPKYVTDISDPNVLSEFASYNTIFTLSALSQSDMENMRTVLESSPHDIIARSGGIGPDANQSSPVTDLRKAFDDASGSPEDKKTLAKAAFKSRQVLGQNRDLYIRSVELDALPPTNGQRQFTAVTQLRMEIVEPTGLTLIERLRGAAINNGYLDHVSAPYLLTIEFKGFDENGNLMNDKVKGSMKRVIPLNLNTMELEITAAGTVYSIMATPITERGFSNNYLYTRTSGTLNPQGKKLKDVIIALNRLLNKQNEDEAEQGQAQTDRQDIYQVAVSPEINLDIPLDFEGDTMSRTGMAAQGATGPDAGEFIADKTTEIPPEFMRVPVDTSIVKLLTDIMKAHPDFTDSKFIAWKQKVATTLKDARDPQEVLDQTKDFYFKYFKIRSTVKPLSETQYDTVRNTNRKKITFLVEPYDVHAYSLAIPGVSTGKNFKSFVYKTYNYIFTGENTNILDVNLNYKVAYFQASLKDFEASDKRRLKIEKTEVSPTGGTTAKDLFPDGNLLLRKEPSRSKSDNAGKTGGTDKQLDQFLDYITHPLADMVNLRLEILGDPAWISQSQFIPINDKNFTMGNAVFKDPDIDYWQANRGRIWNDKLRCFNTDVAEPIIMFNFRTPADFDNNTGVYELKSGQSAEFSGLYRVVKIEHRFVDGKYTSILHTARFDNQGTIVSDPTPTAKITNTETGESKVIDSIQALTLNKNTIKNFFTQKVDLTSIKRKFNDIVNRLKGFN